MTTCECERFLAPLQTWEDVRKRCDDTPDILRTCEVVERGDWRLLERCRVCGRYWACEYPFSAQHGGGPSCAYHVPHAALPAEYVTAKLVEGADWFGRVAATPDAADNPPMQRTGRRGILHLVRRLWAGR